MHQILVTSDLSAASIGAFTEAGTWFKRFQPGTTRLTLLHVGEWQRVLMMGTGESFPVINSREVLASIREHAQNALNKLAEQHLIENPVTPVVVESLCSPAEEIAEYARRHSVNLIVIASHGYSGLKRIFMGSVTERLLSLSPCPVLVVPTEADVTCDQNLLENMIVTTDFSEASYAAFPVAREFYLACGQKNAQLAIVHVAEDLTRETFGLSLGVDREAVREEVEAQAQRKLEELRERYFPGLPVMTSVIRAEQPAERELANYVQSHNVNLVVIASHGRSGFEQFFVGSATRRLLHSLRRKILVVPGPHT